MNIPRFVKEYAKYIKAKNRNNELMNPGIRAEIARRVDWTLQHLENGYITISETMRYLSNDCTREDEDMGQYMTA